MQYLKAVLLVLMTSCQSTSSFSTIRTATLVDLEKFSGQWYVIANIPTFIEKDAYNSVESYAVAPDGKIETTFTFNKGGFDGAKKVYSPTASVRDGTGNAIWGMQFVWPFKAEYRIIYIDPDYEFTIIGRSKRDYVWLMAREASIADADYQRLISIIQEQGYDLDNLRKVPHGSSHLD